MGRIFEYAILLGHLSIILAIQNNGDVTTVKNPIVEKASNASLSEGTTSHHLRKDEENKENFFANRIGEEGPYLSGHRNHSAKPRSNQMTKTLGLSSYLAEPPAPVKRKNPIQLQARKGFNYPPRHGRDSFRRGYIPPFSQELLPAKGFNKYSKNNFGGRNLQPKDRPPRPNNSGNKSFGHFAGQESRNYNSYRKYNSYNQNGGGRSSRFYHQRQNSKVCDACNSVPWVPLLNVPNAYRQERNQHFESYKHNYPPFDYHAVASNTQDFLLSSTPLVPPTPTVLDGTISSSYGLPAGNIPTGHGLLAPLNHVVLGHNSYSAQSTDYSNALTYFTPPSILESSPIPELSPVPIVPIYDSGPFYPGPLLDSSDVGLVPPAPSAMSVSNVVFTISEGKSQGTHHSSNSDAQTAHSTTATAAATTAGDNLNFKATSADISDTQAAHTNLHNNLNYQQVSSGVSPPIAHSNANENSNYQHGTATSLQDVRAVSHGNVQNNLNFQQNYGTLSEVVQAHVPHASVQNDLNYRQNSGGLLNILHVPQIDLTYQQNSGSVPNVAPPPAHADVQNNLNFQQNLAAPQTAADQTVTVTNANGHGNFDVQQSSNVYSDVQTSHTNVIENLNFKHNLPHSNDENKEQQQQIVNGQHSQRGTGLDIVKSVPLAEFSTLSARTPGINTESIVLQNPHGDHEKVVDNDLSDFVPPPPPPYFNSTNPQGPTFRVPGDGNTAESHFQPSFHASQTTSQSSTSDSSGSWLFLDAQTGSDGANSAPHQIINQPAIDHIAPVINNEFRPIPSGPVPVSILPVGQIPVSQVPMSQVPVNDNQSKKIQIIIPYTTKSKNEVDANSFESVRHEVFQTLQSLSNKSELEYLAKFSTTSAPSTTGGVNGNREIKKENVNSTSGGKTVTNGHGDIDRNKKYVTEMQHILAKNIKELLLREAIGQTGKQNYPLQNNIDNWTALEYSNHNTVGRKESKEINSQALSVTSIPGTSITHSLFPSKKIPEEYFATTPSPFSEKDWALKSLFKVTNSSVYSRPFTATSPTTPVSKNTGTTLSQGGNYTVVGKSRVNYWGGKINDNLVLPESAGSTRSIDATIAPFAANATSLSLSRTNKIEIVTPVSVTPRKSEPTRRTTRHVRVTERTVFKRANNTARQYFQRLRTPTSSYKRTNATKLSYKIQNSTKLENLSKSSGDNRKNNFRSANFIKTRRRNQTSWEITTPSTTTVSGGDNNNNNGTEVTSRNATKTKTETERRRTTTTTTTTTTSPRQTPTETLAKDNSTSVKLFPVSDVSETKNPSPVNVTANASANANKSEDLQSINDIFPFRNKELPWEAFDLTNSRQNAVRQRKSLVKQVKSQRSKRATSHSLRPHTSAGYSELGT